MVSTGKAGGGMVIPAPPGAPSELLQPYKANAAIITMNNVFRCCITDSLKDFIVKCFLKFLLIKSGLNDSGYAFVFFISVLFYSSHYFLLQRNDGLLTALCQQFLIFCLFLLLFFYPRNSL